MIIINKPLFPRYVFIRLGWGDSAKSFAPIRSTIKISRLVSFGSEVAKIDDVLINSYKHGRQRF